MRWEFRPDWLTLTGRYEDTRTKVSMPADHQSAEPFALGLRDTVVAAIGDLNWSSWKAIRSPQFYRYAWQSSDGIMFAAGDGEQGYMIQLHGKWWQCDVNSISSVRAAAALYNLKPTRFDVALTVERAGEWESMTAGLFSSFVELAKQNQGRRKPIRSIPYAHNENYRTFYYGSRRSAKFCRIYDKDYFADSVNIDTRVEMEYKKDMAKVMFELWGAGKQEAVFGDMSHFLFASAPEADNPLMCVWGVPAERVSAPPKKDEHSARQEWFGGIVLTAFKKWLADDPAAAAIWLWQAQKAWDEKFAHLDI